MKAKSVQQLDVDVTYSTFGKKCEEWRFISYIARQILSVPANNAINGTTLYIAFKI